MAIQKEQQTAIKDDKPEEYQHIEHARPMAGRTVSPSADRMSLDKPDVVHADKVDGDVEQSAWESDDTSIDSLPTSKFVWLVATTASIAGSLFGYDTGIISAVLVYLGNDLNNRPVSSSEKELITSLCSGGAFVGAIIAGLTADKVCSSLVDLRIDQMAKTVYSLAARWQSISAVVCSPLVPFCKHHRTPSHRCLWAVW